MHPVVANKPVHPSISLSMAHKIAGVSLRHKTKQKSTECFPSQSVPENYKLHSLELPLAVSKDPSYSSISQEGELLSESDRMDSSPGSVSE